MFKMKGISLIATLTFLWSVIDNPICDIKRGWAQGGSVSNVTIESIDTNSFPENKLNVIVTDITGQTVGGIPAGNFKVKEKRWGEIKNGLDVTVTEVTTGGVGSGQIAVTDPGYDKIGEILTNMGYQFAEIQDSQLANYDYIKQFKAIFINCSDDCDYNAPSAANSLRQLSKMEVCFTPLTLLLSISTIYRQSLSWKYHIS